MNIIYVFLHIISLMGMATSIVWLAFRAKKERVKLVFMMCQTLIIIWSASKIADLTVTSSFQLYICYLIGNLGVCFIGSSWVHFSVLYRAGGRKHFIHHLPYALSVLNYAAVVTNPLHHMYYTELSTDAIVHGPLFYENVFFTYACILAGIAVIYRKSFVERRFSRRQAVFIALSVIVPTVLNIFFIAGVTPERFDPTPFGFSLTSIFILLAVYKYDFLDVNYMTFPNIFRNVPGGIIIADGLGSITYINETAKEYAGEISAPDDIYAVVDDSGFSAKKNDGFSEAEVNLNGRRINIRRYNHFDGENIMAAAFIMTDITKYHELIEKTRKLNTANEEIAVEKERNRIAQEVHDTAGHTLTMINSAANILRIKFPDMPDEAMEYVEHISTEATAGISTLRMAINNMKKQSYTGITDGIKLLADSVRGTECEVCVQGEETEKYLFCSAAVCRCCRESITNSLRYSGADRIDIVVKFLESSLEVYIFDNGCGCSEIHEGNGLSGIENRIREIGGTVSFMSSEGNGFTTAIKIPLEGKM
ncbi:MAG: histidine kinase [Oscillospiraceae bacterium]|nr:histidine kinase [Oscillospiraceae bacterium]